MFMCTPHALLVSRDQRRASDFLRTVVKAVVSTDPGPLEEHPMLLRDKTLSNPKRARLASN